MKTDALKKKTEKLRGLLNVIPPDFGQIRAELENGHYSAEEVSFAGFHFVSEVCFNEMLNRDYETHRFSEPVLLQNEHSTFLYKIIETLFEFGLDPNAIFERSNIMWYLPHIDNEYVAADTLNFLLDHGGKTDLLVDGENLFMENDFNVWFDAIEQFDRRRYDALMHCWFVYLGHGALTDEGKVPVTVCERSMLYDEYDWEPFKLSDLKNHRNFTFCLIFGGAQREKRTPVIVDKRTRWEVARL